MNQTTAIQKIMTQFRCVVTGHDDRGRAVIASDEMVGPVEAKMLGDIEMHQLWGADAPIVFPDSGAHPEKRGWPPLGGFRFWTFQLPPDTSKTAPSWSEEEFKEAADELDSVWPGYMKAMEADPTGFHKSATVDLEYILEGEVVVELDDGVETTLKAGDFFVQNGTRHHWHNRSSAPVRILIVMLGVEHQAL